MNMETEYMSRRKFQLLAGAELVAPGSAAQRCFALLSHSR